MRFRTSCGMIATALLFIQIGAAHAHIVAARLGDFYAGALHPFTDLQDVILWLAIGVLAGSLGPAKGRWLVLVFPVGLLTGAVLARNFGFGPLAITADAGMILLLGLLLAAAAQIPAVLLGAIAFGLAVVRGVANTGDFQSNTDRLLFVAGLVVAGYAVITLTMALTLALKGNETAPSTSWRSITIRAFGGWIAAIGLMMMAFVFAT